MKRSISMMLIGFLSIGVVFSAYKKVPKNEKMQYRFEPAQTDHVHQTHGSTPIVMPNTRNSGNFALVDSSGNGYGMVAASTHPIFVDLDNEYWFTSYRQYAGEQTTHGQLGGAFSEDGEDWTVYTNLNYNGNPPWGGGSGTGNGGTGTAQARYPSALGTEEAPIAIWNEYCGNGGEDNGSLYNGRPYYAYDTFGWDGGSLSYPSDLDPLWLTDTKDFWVGSPAVSYDDDEGTYVFNVAYNDWTRNDRWLFRSEAYEDGFIVFGQEYLIIDEVNDLVGGDSDGSFNTSPYVSCTQDGTCMAGLIGLFLGADTDASDVSNYHTGIFRMSDDHGATWGGCDGSVEEGCADSYDGTGYYFIPDSVWDDVVANFEQPVVEDECEGTTHTLDSFWTYYEDDMKVDAEGNVHFVIQVLPCESTEEGFCWYTSDAGLYHIKGTNNGVGEPMDWSWSYVMTGEATWSFSDMTGDTYIWNNLSSLSFSVENTDIVYIVTGMGTPGEVLDPSVFDDPCYITTMADYPEWSEDIYVIKSEDGGATWWNPLNVTNTPDETGGICPNNLPKCAPEETYPHSAQWATDDEVYIVYQMPNFAFNEIGDLLSPDFMNRVYAGTAVVDDGSSIDEYPGEWQVGGCYGDPGDVTGDGVLNVLDIVGLVNHILGINALDDTCAADYSGDGIINVLDIVGLVNNILGIGRTSHVDATEATINIEGNSMNIQSDGYIGGIDMTVKYAGSNFSVDFSSSHDVAEYIINNDGTARIIVASSSDINEVLSVSSGTIVSVEDVALVTSDEENAGYVVLSDSSIDIFGTPDAFSVGSAYPNPFNPSTNLSLELNTTADVSVKVFNVMGQLVDVIAEGTYSPNTYNWTWNAENLASGVYLVRTQVGSSVDNQKVMLLK